MTLKESLDELKKDDIDYKILYLEATDRTLLRRYNETEKITSSFRGRSCGYRAEKGEGDAGGTEEAG